MHLRATFFLFIASCISLCGVVLNQDDIAAGKLGRPIGNVERLLKQLQVQKNFNGFSLVEIENICKHDPLPVMQPGTSYNLNKYYYSLGNISILDLADPKHVTDRVPYLVYESGSRNFMDEMGNTFSPYFNGNLTTTFAVCKLPAKSTEPLAKFPETYVIPDSWVKDMGELLASPSLADYTKNYVTNLDPVATGSTVPKLPLFIYGANLAKTNPQEFVKEFPDLIANGDVYTGAYFTDLLLSAAVVQQVDPGTELNALIKELSKPEVLAAIALGIERYCDTHPAHISAALAVNARLRLLIELIRSKIQPNDAKWDQVTQITNSVLHVYLQ
jgi:hypothetical protein